VKLPFRKEPATIIAIDVGSRLIKVVELAAGEERPQLLRYGISQLSPDAVVGGEIMDRDLLLEGILSAFERAGIEPGPVVSAVSSRSVIVKRLLMDQMAEDVARELIEAEASNHIPFDVEDVCLDFQVLEPDAGEGKMEVLLVAAKREVIYEHLQLLREAQMRPKIIDVDAFAIQNLHEALGIDQSLYTLVNVGSEITSINIVREGIPVFTRDFAAGCNSYLETLQRDLQIPYEEALNLLGKGVDALEAEETGQESLSQLVEEIAIGLERSLAYLRSSGELEDLGTIYLSGGGGNLPNLKEKMEERLRMPVKAIDPTEALVVDEELEARIRDEGSATLLNVAIGLGLREVAV